LRLNPKKFLIITIITSLLIIISFAESKTNSPDADDYNKSILLKNAKIDTSNAQTSKAVQNIAISNYHIEEDEFYLVQFKGYIHEEWKQALHDAGAVLYDYVPNNAFIARMNSSVKTKVGALDPVQWVGPYQPGYKVSTALSYSAVIESQEIITENITVLLFDARDNERVLNEITGLGGEIISNSGDRIRIIIERTKISGISQINGINWIEKYVPPVLMNDVAANITGPYPLRNTHGLTGAGQIVAVADTGLDTGVNDNTMHADIRGRIAAIHAWWSENGDNGAGDNNGHGTHVTGSVLGNGSQSSGQYAGMAPGATLVFQAMQYDGPDPSMNGGFYIPIDLSSLFQEAYNDGAKIHSNSWGSDIPALYGSYTSDSRYVDSFIWNNPDMLIVFAAGNEGIYGDNTVTPPATAKNAISVGASENFRIEKGGSSDNINDIAYFSSRGFTDDNRIKPDIVAPGTYIISTRSSKPNASYPYGILDPYYAYGSGTSMATPIVAGTAALVREYFVENKSISPSAALIKAALINGAINLGLPKNDQGWGRVDIENSLFPASPRTVRYYDNNTGLRTSQSWNVSYEVGNSSEPLRVTLVWSDYPGAAYAGITLVNNLDLAVSGPGGTYYGNGAPDNRNNVEEVELISPSTGAYTIFVNGTNIPHGPQPFALVISGAFNISPPIVNYEYPTNNSYTNNNTTNVEVSITDSESVVNLSSINMTINGDTVTFTNTSIANGYRIQEISPAPYSDGRINISVNATNSDSKLLTYSWSFIVDTHPPDLTINPVSYERGTAAKTGSIIEFNISADDPVINGTSSGLKNASVNAFQINNTGLIALTNNSGFWKGNVTFDMSAVDGNHSLNISFSDNAGNINNSIPVNISIDNTPLLVNELSISSAFINLSDSVNITANITSSDSVSLVNQSELFARVTYPNGTYIDHPLSNGGGSQFYKTFTDTAQYGRYYVTILANDTTGNTNRTQRTQFITVYMTNLVVNITGGNTETLTIAPYSNTSLRLNVNNPSNGTIKIYRSKVNLTSNALGVTNPGIYVLVNASPSIKNNLSYVILSVNYSDSEVSSYVEGSLRLYRWNTSSVAWEKLSVKGSPSYVNDAGVDMTNNYVWANITALSEFAIAGNPYIPPTKTSLPSGGGGGGGGGGGASGENYSNIEVTEKYDLSIYKDKTTSFRFKDNSNPIIFVNITGNVSFGEITTSVEVLKNNSTMVKTAPPGIVYKNANIWVGSSSFNSPKNIKQGVIRFRVKNNWIDENNIQSTIMVRWNKNSWENLETNEIEKDDTFTYYDAFTTTFSNFAIIGTNEAQVMEISALVPAGAQGLAAVVSSTPAAESTKNMSGFKLSMLIVSFCTVYLFSRK
jgi:PGF-pre-PGF domain-containing protein